MLETLTIVRIPYADRLHELAQIIYMPVLALFLTEMS